jgi:hypothetical protein
MKFFSNKIKSFIVAFFCIFLSFSVTYVSAKPNLMGQICVTENIQSFIDNKIRRYRLQQEVDTGNFASQDCLLIDMDASKCKVFEAKMLKIVHF